MPATPAPAPGDPVAAPRTSRARAREAMTADIKAIARRQLAEHGPDGLNLRAVARELGVVSSAVYRYFASRDELLTALIIDAYDAVGEAAEQAATEEATDVRDRVGRIARAIRTWAVANPRDYALVYGSPVPGYQAPEDTISPALRVTGAFVAAVVEGLAAGEIDPAPWPPSATPVPGPVAAEYDAIRTGIGADVPDEVLSRALLVWTALFGHLSYTLFGHLHRGITDYDAFFEHQLDRWCDLLVGRPTR
ncbi:MAG: TetR/AcrR family transcriptional regulator [Acidimicrobiales bacterium]